MRNLFLVLLMFLVSACGQKGPLFLPEPKAESAAVNSASGDSPDSNRQAETQLKPGPAPNKDELESQLKAKRNSNTP